MKLADGRAEWLGRFILPHEPALRIWLSRRHLGDLDVDDVVQEAYAKLILLPSAEGIRDVRAYLYQVARSVVADHLRRRKVVTIVAAESEIGDVAADEPSIETLISDREELQRLAWAIAALPEPTRTVFRLRRIDQMSQRAISEHLRMPESTVEKHVSRALTQMSRLFGRGGSGRPASARVGSRSAWDGNGSRDGTTN